ncbi:MAG: helix-turn-helix transcriptional regulator, partial [Firmicutes bacterium]|nr:helix-turn-helix transcriptional regulator [Bacillota bacterium]
ERLIRQTQLCNKEEVKNIFNQLYQENFIRRKLPVNIIKQLFVALKNTLYRIIDEEIFTDIPENVNINKYYQHIVDVFLKVCTTITARRQVGRKELAKKIIKYLETNYTQPDLCLMAVAEEFKLCTSYVSQIFKEEIGKNFSDYLEELRLNHACRLLAGTDLSVTAIAAQVGYGSDKAFRRAFKRARGISPTDFRKTVHGA